MSPASGALEQLSDLELVELSRDGSTDAFGQLWLRHSAAGRAVARGQRFDADDLMSESFARILKAIRAGGGPTTAFRPYLFTTIRNVSMQWGREAQKVSPSDELDLLADPSSEEDASLAALDRSLTVRAFRTLPTRWQEALWYSEVEQMSAQEIAPLLGMKSNAVSALTFRAREGLRQAWIQAHLTRATDPECRATIEKLGAYTRDTLGPREMARVDAHLEECASCAIVAEEARRVGSHMALSLLPLAAGIGGAAAYMAWLDTGRSAAGMASAAAMPAPQGTGAEGSLGADGGSGLSSASAAPKPAKVSMAAGTTMLIAAVAVVALAVTLGPGVVGSMTRRPEAPVAEPPTSEPIETPVRPAPEPDPVPEQIIIVEAPIVEAPVVIPQRPVTPPVAPPVVAPPVVVPPVEPEPEPPLNIPSYTVDDSAGPRIFPLFSGTDARPGALIEILDADGAVIASATASPLGAWGISDFVTDAAGTRQVAVRQSLDGEVSPLSAASPLTIVAAPVIISPLDGETLSPGMFFLTVTGDAGTTFQRVVNGNPRADIKTFDALGERSDSFTVPQGVTELVVRYFDEASGRYGMSSAAVTMTNADGN